MKRLYFFMTLAACLFLLVCCSDNEPEKIVVNKQKISGVVQKGPFINGTSIVVSELDASFALTGKTYDVQIMDNSGKFELRSVKLISEYAQLKADGYYFNEVTGEQSASQLTLYAIADMEGNDSVCVNVLTHLEKGRIEYLLGQGMAFEEARTQAHNEILTVFGFSDLSSVTSEQMDITQNTDNGATLLAISVILQGFRDEAELSELLANLMSDIREDGTLDNSELGSELINHASLLDLSQIRKNLEKRYSEIDKPVTIPDFESKVNYFIENTSYAITSKIEYPVTSNYGTNILADQLDTVVAWNYYSMAAKLPPGTSLKIYMQGSFWGYVVLPDKPVNWDADLYNFENLSQNFFTPEPGIDCDLIIQFNISNESETVGENVQIDYYENGSKTITKSKQLYVKFAIPQ